MKKKINFILLACFIANSTKLMLLNFNKFLFFNPFDFSLAKTTAIIFFIVLPFKSIDES